MGGRYSWTAPMSITNAHSSYNGQSFLRDKYYIYMNAYNASLGSSLACF